MEQSSSDEEIEKQNSSTKKNSSLLKQRLQVTKPTLRLPGGFHWDEVGVVKGDGGTSSESEEEAEQDEKEVRVQYLLLHR